MTGGAHGVARRAQNASKDSLHHRGLGMPTVLTFQRGQRQGCELLTEPGSEAQVGRGCFQHPYLVGLRLIVNAKESR